jgi:hypothetical protein
MVVIGASAEPAKPMMLYGPVTIDGVDCLIGKFVTGN